MSQTARLSPGYKRMMAVFVVCTAALLFVSANRVEARGVEPLVQLSFEEKDGQSNACALTNGIIGRGCVVGQSAPFVHPFPQPLSLSEGSVVFWFYPIDWDDVSFVELIRLMGMSEGALTARLRVYVVPHHWRGLSVLHYLADGSRQLLFCHQCYVEHWKSDPTRWHHAVFTWDASGGILYIDGLETSREREMGPMMEPFHALRIGAPTLHHIAPGKSKRTGRRTILDEIRLYDTVLTQEQIRGEYETQMGALIEADDF